MQSDYLAAVLRMTLTDWLIGLQWARRRMRRDEWREWLTDIGGEG